MNKTHICLRKKGTAFSLLFYLEHPRTGERIRYAIDNSKLLQVKSISPNTSWFIDDTIQSHSSFLLFTPMDVRFILLPVLETCRQGIPGVFCTVDQILHSKPGLEYLQDITHLERLVTTICDRQQDTNGFVYRLNDTLVMQWLQRKVQRIFQSFATFPTLLQLERTYLQDTRFQSAPVQKGKPIIHMRI
jgi:hypothetical protein